VRTFDLIIIGTGSGNSIPGPEFADWDIAIVEDGKFGGTCTNVGCIPTKMFVHPADLADAVRLARPLGVDAHLDAVHWPAIRDRIFGRIDAIEDGGRRYRKGERSPNTTVYEGIGRFVGAKELEVSLHDGTVETILADKVVIAAGARPRIPPIPGLAELPATLRHTSDTVMRIDELPARVLIIGGGYVGAEFAHVFGSFGSQVTVVARTMLLLPHHDTAIAEAYTAHAGKRFDVRLHTEVVSVEPGTSAGPDGLTATLTDGGSVEADIVLVATGREPNGNRLDVERTGVGLDGDGRVVVDRYQQSAVDGIFALGDVSSAHQLKHVANHEARVVAHNLLHPEAMRAADHRFVPSAVFTDPQVAAVGLTEEEAIDRGVDYVTYTQRYGDIAAGWAREDTTNFLKVLADPVTGMLIGAHVIGPEAATVIQPVIQSMSFGLSAHETARGQYWIHPALSELVENALLGLPEPTGGTPGRAHG
jgi:mycothione reductase